MYNVALKSKYNYKQGANVEKESFSYRQAVVAEEAMRGRQESQLGTEAFRVAFLELKQYM